MTRKWTVMVHLAGDNNLSSECIYSLTEMRRSGSNKDVAVIANLNTSVHNDTSLFITRNTQPGDTNEKLVQSLELRIEQKALALARSAIKRSNGGENDSAPVQKSYFDSIFDFFEECITKYPAQHYMVVLSGHGAGVIGNFLPEGEADRIDSLTVVSMAQLMAKVAGLIRTQHGLSERVQAIDILGFDNCLMSMTEVAYIVNNAAGVMIGAEGFEPMAGWPYLSVLDAVKDFAKDKDDGGTAEQVKDLSKQIVSDYVNFYTDYQAAGVSVDQSACDLSQSEELMWAINSLAQVLLKYLPDPYTGEGEADAEVRNALVLAHWEAQPYKNEQYTDLYDFCERLKFYAGGLPARKGDVRRACQNVLNAIRGSENEGD